MGRGHEGLKTILHYFKYTLAVYFRKKEQGGFS